MFPVLFSKAYNKVPNVDVSTLWFSVVLASYCHWELLPLLALDMFYCEVTLVKYSSYLLFGAASELTHLNLASNKKDTGKQCRTRSDAAECGVWSGSIQFTLSSNISVTMITIKTNRLPLYRKWTCPKI